MKQSIWILTYLNFLFSIGYTIDPEKKGELASDLDSLKYSIITNYAPVGWKQEHLGWSIENEFAKGLDLIKSDQIHSAGDYHKLVKRVFSSLNDYHVSLEFHARDLSFFPLSVTRSEGRYFISNFDLSLLHLNLDWMDLHWLIADGTYIRWYNKLYDDDNRLLLTPGTEILAIDEIDIQDYIKSFITKELGENTTPTGYALATKMLFKRLGKRGSITPNGTLKITILDKMDNQIKTLSFQWLHFQEDLLSRSLNISKRTKNLSNFSLKNLKRTMEKDYSVELMNDYLPKSHHITFFSSISKYDLFEKRSKARKGFLSDLGKVTWDLKGKSSLYAYLYKNENGKSIGYIYLPTFKYDDDEDEELVLKDLEQALLKFKKSADALVFDITNNGGGYLSFMYEVLSMLSNKELKTYLEHEILTPQRIHKALKNRDILYEKLSQTKDKEEETEIHELLDYFSFLIKNYEKGQYLSDLTHILGKEFIKPNKKINFDLPIIVLINELDFSCADFFPALLKDNKVATLFGKNTAGAGGAVYSYYPSSKFGVYRYTLTGSLAFRTNGDPIENLGVAPDIPYEISVKDLTEDYVEYKAALNTAINDLIE